MREGKKMAKRTENSSAAGVFDAGAEALDAPDLGVVDEIVREKGTSRAAAIPILQAIQEHFRYLPARALMRVCEITEIRAAQLEGVSTFYSQFRHMPVGKHLISVCHGTACHVAGAEGIAESIRSHLGIEDDEDTDKDRLFTIQKVACLGCCSLAPVMRIDERTYGHLTRETAPKALAKFLREIASETAPRRARRTRAKAAARKAPQIRIALDSCCIASGTLDVKRELDRQIAELGLEVAVKCSGCHGMCHRAPFVEVVDDAKRLGTAYSNVTPEFVRNLLRAAVPPKGFGGALKSVFGRACELLFDDDAWLDPRKLQTDPEQVEYRAFRRKQKFVVLEGSAEWDPRDIDEYIASGGFKALEKSLRELSPRQIVDSIAQSGLRGRGGAGYFTGKKLDMVRRRPPGKKYVIMNGDEGDPGAFMDRMLLESCPYRVLEGLAIAARAAGADEGYLYIRAEYPLAVHRIREAVAKAEERHLLGERIFGSSFSLKLHVREGAGAFVCGEETGLIASIEGERGMPRFRPPYPVEAGLWGAPTCINNVETYANIPWIITHGPDEFARIGTESSKGTKVFALAGKVRRGGLIEVPMGITIREIVEEIGGGIRDDRAFKAVQIGGPAGGCVPASLADTPIDFEALDKTGAIMGSGGLVILDDTTCMVELALFFLRGTQDESCGKCTFCRVGTKRLLEILENICAGRGKPGDIERLEQLAHRIKTTSLCGLGRNAPNPVLTTLKFFRDEYEAHLEGRCPAKRCRALITYRITDECIGCTLCAQQCPVGAIEPNPYERHEIDVQKCVRCGTCKSVCPAEAVEVE